MGEPVTVTLRTDDPDATRAVGAALSASLQAGDVVALSGELGAGKTCLVQGAAAGLDVEGRVTSPTFVLVKSYRGRVPLVHCDVYRLDRLGDLDGLGDDVMSGDSVTFIEWADAVAAVLPTDRLEIDLVLDGGPPGEEPSRTITLRGFGVWAQRWAALTDAVATWTV